MLHIGDDQFVKSGEVIFLLDYKKTAAKELWKLILSKTPEKALNLSRGKGRKMETLIITKTGHAVVTFLTRRRVANKLGILGETNAVGIPLASPEKRGRGRPKKTDVPGQAINDTFKPDPD